MAGYHLTDEEWIESWNKIGSPAEFGRLHGIAVRNVMARRRSIESRLKIELPTFASQNPAYAKKIEQTPGHVRRGMDIEKGRVIVFSDAHFWPDDTTTAFKALLEMIKEYRPTAIVCNGDALDGANLSRFPRQDWNSGFVMLSFERSKLLQPEMVRVWGEDEVEFRGKIHKV